MKPYYHIFLILYAFLQVVRGQNNPNWDNYSYFNKATDIVSNNEYILVSTHGGIFKYQKATGEISVLNRANASLTGNVILDLSFDNDGSLWYTTRRYGIGKLAGNINTVYNSSNSGLPFNQWNKKIKIDKDGNIWIASFSWLAKFDGVNWKSWETGNILHAHPVISDIAFDSQNTAWICSNDGLGKIVDDEYIILPDFIRTLDRSMAIDKEDNIWIAANGYGLYLYDGDTTIRYTSSNSSLLTNSMTDIFFDDKTGLWLATNYGIVNFDTSNCKIYNPEPDTSLSIRKITLDDYGSIWCADYEGNIYEFQNEEFTKIELFKSILNSNNAKILCVDDSNIKWIGAGNITRINDASLDQLNYNSASAAVQDNYGAIWLAFSEGDVCVIKMTNNDTLKFDSVNSPFIPNTTYISHMRCDSENNVWFSTKSQGLLKFDGNKFTTYCTTNCEIPSNEIFEFNFDSEGNLWGGSAGGLFKFNGFSWKVWNKSNSELPSNIVINLSIDPGDIIWISCMDEGRIVGVEYGEGITRFDGQNMIKYNISNSGIKSNTVFGILAEEDNIWLATWGAGLTVFDRKITWTNFNVANSGIASNNCNSIKRDHKGYIWIGHSNAGISVYKGDSIFNRIENYASDLNELMIYPNPPGETMYIQTNKGEQIAQARIFDLSGRMLTSVPVKQVQYDHALYQLQLGNLDASGILILQVKTTTGKTMSERFYYNNTLVSD